MIQTQPGRVDEAAATLRAVSPTNVVEIVQGPFDIIARAEGLEAESELMNRCHGAPFIRVLPCRTRPMP